MPLPTPHELVTTHGARTPEQYADLLGFEVKRVVTSPMLPGVTVLSAFQATRTILLYRPALAQLAAQRREPLMRLEQWHIAHELYHGLSHFQGISSWRVRETEADLWADELLTLVPAG